MSVSHLVESPIFFSIFFLRESSGAQDSRQYKKQFQLEITQKWEFIQTCIYLLYGLSASVHQPRDKSSSQVLVSVDLRSLGSPRPEPIKTHAHQDFRIQNKSNRSLSFTPRIKVILYSSFWYLADLLGTVQPIVTAVALALHMVSEKKQCVYWFGAKRKRTPPPLVVLVRLEKFRSILFCFG